MTPILSDTCTAPQTSLLLAASADGAHVPPRASLASAPRRVRLAARPPQTRAAAFQPCPSPASGRSAAFGVLLWRARRPAVCVRTRRRRPQPVQPAPLWHFEGIMAQYVCAAEACAWLTPR